MSAMQARGISLTSAGTSGEAYGAAPAALQSDAQFSARLLLWKMTEAEREERDQVRERLLRGFRLPPAFFLQELGAPSAAVRAEALRFLEHSLPLEDVSQLLPLLRDYNVDVREQARRTVSGVVQRYAQQPLEKGLGAADDASLRGLLQSFSALAATSDMGSGNVMLDVLTAIGASRPREFWTFFAQCPDTARQNLATMFLTRRTEATRRALLLGAAYAPAAVRDRLEHLFRRTLTYETVRGDIDLYHTLDEGTQEKVFRGLDVLGVLGAYLEKVSWIRPCHRPALLAMIPKVGGIGYRDALLRALGTPDPETVMAALRVSVAESVPGLVEAVLHHLKSTDEEAVGLSLSYLRVFGGCDLMPTLLPLLSGESAAVRREANRAVSSITERHLLANYDSLPAEKRRMLGRMLQKLDPGFANTVVLRMLRADPEEKIRLIQILSAMEAVDPEIQESVRRLCEDKDNRIRASAAGLLHLLEGEDQFTVGLRFLYDPEPRVRANAVEGLRMECPEVAERLVELAEDGMPRERANAIKRLWEGGHEDAAELFERFVAEEDPGARLSAAWLYGELAPDGAVSALRKYLEDPDAKVRVQAVYSLGKTAEDADIRALTQHLDDGDPGVRQAVQSVIQRRLHLEYQIG